MAANTARKSNKRSPYKVRALEQEQRALKLRREGWTFGSIAAQLGVTEVGALQIVQRAMQKIKDENLALAAEEKALTLARFDDALKVAYARMNSLDPELSLKGALAVARIETQRANVQGWTKGGVQVNINNVNAQAPEPPPTASSLKGATVEELVQLKELLSRIRQRQEPIQTPSGALVIGHVVEQ